MVVCIRTVGLEIPKKLHDMLRPIVFIIAALHRGVIQIAISLVASSARCVRHPSHV